VSAVRDSANRQFGIIMDFLHYKGTVPEYRLCPIVPTMRLRLGSKSSK
jgi:hypothetical protein